MILEARKLAREQEGEGLKILTPNQILKRFPIALAQIKAGNNSERSLNEITKMLYNNIINSIKANIKWIQSL